VRARFTRFARARLIGAFLGGAPPPREQTGPGAALPVTRSETLRLSVALPALSRSTLVPSVSTANLASWEFVVGGCGGGLGGGWRASERQRQTAAPAPNSARRAQIRRTTQNDSPPGSRELSAPEGWELRGSRADPCSEAPSPKAPCPQNPEPNSALDALADEMLARSTQPARAAPVARASGPRRARCRGRVAAAPGPSGRGLDAPPEAPPPIAPPPLAPVPHVRPPPVTAESTRELLEELLDPALLGTRGEVRREKETGRNSSQARLTGRPASHQPSNRPPTPHALHRPGSSRSSSAPRSSSSPRRPCARSSTPRASRSRSAASRS
jgi:hypothetical protein